MELLEDILKLSPPATRAGREGALCRNMKVYHINKRLVTYLFCYGELPRLVGRKIEECGDKTASRPGSKLLELAVLDVERRIIPKQGYLTKNRGSHGVLLITQCSNVS